MNPPGPRINPAEEVAPPASGLQMESPQGNSGGIWSTSQVEMQGCFAPKCPVIANGTEHVFNPPDFRRSALREQEQIPFRSKTPLAFVTLGKIKFAPE